MQRSIAALLMLSIAGLALAGCYHIPIGEPIPLEPATPDLPTTAFFSFGPIDVSPQPFIVGQPLIITMPVENEGTAAKTYMAELLINGKTVSSQAVTVGPGGIEQVSFQASFAAPGRYEVSIGPQSRAIDVEQPKPQITLKISGDVVDGFDPLVGSTSDPTQVHDTVEGHIIKLTAPTEGFAIESIRIFGYTKSSTYDFDHNPIYGPGIWVYGPDIAAAEPLSREFTVNIYDMNHNRLYSGNFSKDLFSYSPGWVTVDIPEVKITGDFLLEVVTHNPPKLNATGWGDWDVWRRYVVHTWYHQICIGYENSIEVQSWMSQDGSIVPDRYFTYNWLIQATGCSL